MIPMLTTLESLIDPISRAQFRERHYGREPLVVRGHPQKFAGLFTWDDFNRLLNTSAYPHANVQIAQPGARRPPGTAASIVAECRAGATLVFNQIDLLDPNVGELARSLAAELGEPANVNLYMSSPGRQGAARHYDRHDVFVLQIYGHKAWSIYAPTVEKPIIKMAEGSYRSPEHPILECELSPGDVLYMPRGHWHEAMAQRELSLHLTVGVHARTGVDFLAWLAEELRDDLHFRQELPLSFADETADVRELRLGEHLAALRERLDARLRDEATIRAFTEHCVLADADIRRFRFPSQLLEAPSAQTDVSRFTRPARQRFVLHDGPGEDQVAAGAWGHIFHFPKNATPLLEFVFSRLDFSRDDAMAHAGELDEQGVLNILDSLLREGIIDVIRKTASVPAPATPGPQ